MRYHLSPELKWNEPHPDSKILIAIIKKYINNKNYYVDCYYLLLFSDAAVI